MISFINKFKIPTLLGLGVIILGIAVGIFLVLREQILITQAEPDLTPQNITLTNIEDQSFTISWQTATSVPSFVSFGQTGADEQVALDDRDQNTPKPHLIHYVTVKNLQSEITYQYKIISGKLISEVFKVITASPPTNQSGLRPVIGSVLDGDEQSSSANKPLEEGVAFLSISGAVTQSALVKNLGNFLIPLSFMRKLDLSDIYQPTEDDIAKLTIVSDKGEVSAIFKLSDSERVLPPLKLGQNVDLTSPAVSNLDKYDLNGDRLVNTTDYSIVLQNFGRPKNKKADINGDGVVDQKDLDLMQKQINQ